MKKLALALLVLVSGCQLISAQANHLNGSSAASSATPRSASAVASTGTKLARTAIRATVAFASESPTGASIAQLDPNKPAYAVVQFNAPVDNDSRLFALLISDTDVVQNQFESPEERRTLCSVGLRIDKATSTWSFALAPDPSAFQGLKAKEQDEIKCFKSLGGMGLKGKHSLRFAISRDNMHFLSDPSQLVGASEIAVDFSSQTTRALAQRTIQLECIDSHGRALPSPQLTDAALSGQVQSLLKKQLRKDKLTQVVIDDDGWHDARNQVTGILTGRDMHVAFATRDASGACWLESGLVYEDFEGAKFGPMKANMQSFTRDPMCCAPSKQLAQK